jgi:hypothetical protein
VNGDDAEKLAELEQDVRDLKASAGTVRLGPATLTLLWVVLLASISAVGFVIRLDGRVEAQAAMLERDDRYLDEHLKAPGHTVALERIEELRRRVDAIETILEKGTRP